MNTTEERTTPKANLVRMRFAKQCVEELRKVDPACQVSVCFVRSLAKRGMIPSVLIGKRRLINFDALLQYLANPMPEAAEAVPLGIRRISE